LHVLRQLAQFLKFILSEELFILPHRSGNLLVFLGLLLAFAAFSGSGRSLRIASGVSALLGGFAWVLIWIFLKPLEVLFCLFTSSLGIVRILLWVHDLPVSVADHILAGVSDLLLSFKISPCRPRPPVITTPFKASTIYPGSIKSVGPNLLLNGSFTHGLLLALILPLNDFLESIILTGVFNKWYYAVAQILVELSCFLPEYLLQLFLGMIIND